MYCIFLGFVYLSYVVFRALFWGGLVAGWGSLISIVLILGGIQCILIGLAGEYIGRIYEQVKGRPVYVIGQISGFLNANQVDDTESKLISK